jgi:hypothetical protein
MNFDDVYTYGNDDLPPINGYGLDVERAADDAGKPYIRYLLSWGGPSTEIRIFEDMVEFVYMDWGVGIGFDVSDDDAFAWIGEEMRTFIEI